MQKKTLHVLLFENHGIWVAQCLEHNIVAQGSTPDAAADSWERVFHGQIAYDLKKGRLPLEHIEPLPEVKRMWEQWQESKVHLVNPTLPIPMTTPPEVPAAEVVAPLIAEMRLAF